MKNKSFISCICIFIFLAAAIPGYAADINIDSTSPFLYLDSSKKISMDFQDASLVNVLKIFSQQTKFNLITSEDIANKRITVYLNNVPVDQALDQILRANSLTYEIQPTSNIYIVKPLLKPATELITRVYSLKHATVPAAKLQKTLNIEKSDGNVIEMSEDRATEVGIIAAITGILTPQGAIVEDPRTNSLIVTDIATNFATIERTIARLDVPVAQILIEVEMLEVTKETADKIGLKAGDTPLSFSGAIRKHVLPWDINDLKRKGYAWEDLQFDGAEYTTGVINASGLTATLQFLRTQTDTKNLARPRIMTLNNETAQIKIATDEAIGIQTQTTASEGVGTSAVEAERIETGVFLTVTPQANVFTNEITMAIAPKVIVARTGSTFDGTTFRDPEERGAQTILRVRSGETIIIGGLMREDISKVVTKIPVLGDIPLIGQAFRHKSETISEKELIIFITPHIMNSTPKSKTTVATAPRFIREQDVPLNKLQEVEKELSLFEKKIL